MLFSSLQDLLIKTVEDLFRVTEGKIVQATGGQ